MPIVVQPRGGRHGVCPVDANAISLRAPIPTVQTPPPTRVGPVLSGGATLLQRAKTAAAQNISGAKAVHEDLRARFPGARRFTGSRMAARFSRTKAWRVAQVVEKARVI